MNECKDCKHWDPTKRDRTDGWGPCISDKLFDRIRIDAYEEAGVSFRKDFGCVFWKEPQRPHKTD